VPTAVQFLSVTFVSTGRGPRGTKAGDVGSSWRSNQWGHTQSAPSLGGLTSLPVLLMAIIFMIRRKSRERQKQDA